jgi:hypothetical protein
MRALPPVWRHAAFPGRRVGLVSRRSDPDPIAAKDDRVPCPAARLALLPALIALAACVQTTATGNGGAGIEQPAPVDGAALPYGEIAILCGVADDSLGTPIATQSGYVIRDPLPTSVSPRTQYITGFPDGCARQFTGALALFGDVGTHEVFRYEPSNASLAWSETDLAYEQIKARVCGAAQGQPCGTALERLGRRTTFVSIYESFGTNPRWADILIHDGTVIAMDFKTN